MGLEPTARKHTKNEIKALVRPLKDIVGALTDADPEDKRAIYDELGVNLTYQDGRVHVAWRPAACIACSPKLLGATPPVTKAVRHNVPGIAAAPARDLRL